MSTRDSSSDLIMPAIETANVTETRQGVQPAEGTVDANQSIIHGQETTDEAVMAGQASLAQVNAPPSDASRDYGEAPGRRPHYEFPALSPSGSLPPSQTVMNTRIDIGATFEAPADVERKRQVGRDIGKSGPTVSQSPSHFVPWLPSPARQIYASPMAYPALVPQPTSGPFPPGFQAYPQVAPAFQPLHSSPHAQFQPTAGPLPPGFQAYVPVAPASQPLPSTSYAQVPFAPRSAPQGRWGYEQFAQTPYQAAGRGPIGRRKEVYQSQDPFQKWNKPMAKPSHVPYNPYIPADSSNTNTAPLTSLPAQLRPTSYIPPRRRTEDSSGPHPQRYRPQPTGFNPPHRHGTYDLQPSYEAPLPIPNLFGLSRPPATAAPPQRQGTYNSQQSNDALYIPGAIPSGPAQSTHWHILPAQTGDVVNDTPDTEQVLDTIDPSNQQGHSSPRHPHSGLSIESPLHSPTSLTYSPTAARYSPTSARYSPTSPAYSPASAAAPNLPASHPDSHSYPRRTHTRPSVVPPPRTKTADDIIDSPSTEKMSTSELPLKQLPLDYQSEHLPMAQPAQSTPHNNFVPPHEYPRTMSQRASPPQSQQQLRPDMRTEAPAVQVYEIDIPSASELNRQDSVTASPKRSYHPDDPSASSLRHSPVIIPYIPASILPPQDPSGLEKQDRLHRSSRRGIGRVFSGYLRSWTRRAPWRSRRASSAYAPYAQGEEHDNTSASDEKSGVMSAVVEFTTQKVPTDLYLVFLLFLPSFYFSRVARLFEEAELAMPEIEQMAIRTSLQAQNFLDEQVPGGQDVFPLQWIRLKSTWEHFIDSLLREWKTLNVISALLLSAILTILQIDDAANDYLTRYTALLSFICSLVSLLFGCIYIIRFATMRKTYKAAEWAMEAQESGTSTWFNVFILLALPSIWLTWSILLYVVCIMSYIWRTAANIQESPPPLSDLTVLKIRIGITILLGLALVYGCFVLATFRRYGSAMDRKWAARIDNWRIGNMYPSDGPPGKPTWESPYPYSYPGGSVLSSVPRDIHRERRSFEKPRARFRSDASYIPKVSPEATPIFPLWNERYPNPAEALKTRERSTGSFNIYQSESSSRRPDWDAPVASSTQNSTLLPSGPGRFDSERPSPKYLPSLPHSSPPASLHRSPERSQSSNNDKESFVTPSSSMPLQHRDYEPRSPRLANVEPSPGPDPSVYDEPHMSPGHLHVAQQSTDNDIPHADPILPDPGEAAGGSSARHELEVDSSQIQDTVSTIPDTRAPPDDQEVGALKKSKSSLGSPARLSQIVDRGLEKA